MDSLNTALRLSISNERKLLRMVRPARFATIGAACAAFQLALLALFNEGTGLGALSNAVAFLVSGQVNFALNAGLTWRDRMHRRPGALIGQVLWFNVLMLLAVALNQAIYVVALLAFPYLVAGAIGIAGTTLVKYFVADRWIFRSAKRPMPAPFAKPVSFGSSSKWPRG